MGELIGGHWHRTGINTWLSDGALQRKPSIFRDWITADGKANPEGRAYSAEAGRFHLYASLACPWAHRALIMRNLKGLQQMVSLSIVHPLMGEEGWTFDAAPGVVPDTVNCVSKLHQLYTIAIPDCTSRVTVPLLWDTIERAIVSNESADIIRMFNSAFDHVAAAPGDYYPSALRSEIDAVNSRIYDTLNNGVYRARFAGTQDAYEVAAVEVFDTLDWLEDRLDDRSWLVGDVLTEADIGLFTTLVRFDAVYHGHFKCNLRRLTDYPRLRLYTQRLADHPAFRPTIDMVHIKTHYYGSHSWLNPSGIIPIGPEPDLGDGLNASIRWTVIPAGRARRPDDRRRREP